MGVNKVILIGNLGRKPEMRYTSKGVPVASFTVATTERWGRDAETGEAKEHTEWHRITAWSKLAEICGQYLDKGTKVYLEGRIRRSEYTDQSGIKRWSTDIHVDQMEILTPKGMRETVPDDTKYKDFPDTAAGGNGGSSSAPAPPDDAGLDEEFDVEADDEYLID